MRQTIRLGHVVGIPVGMHWSVLVIMVLLAQMLAMSLLPTAAPDLPGLTYWLVAVGVTAVFLAALLAHEAAHAIVAKHYGVGVKSITLWLLGGVAQLEGEAPHARGDLAIAIAGPATSLATSVLFGFGAFAAGRGGASEITVAALAWLAVVNLVLAVFNMLPGAPLDGGRVLRAAVWWVRGDRLAAQRIASRAGIIVGGLMIAGGLVQILFTANLSGIWLMLVGWFLVAAARAEDIEAQLRSRLSGITVGDVMSSPVVTAGESQTVESFVETIARDRPHRMYPVLSIDGRLTGLISLGRLSRIPASQRSSLRLSGIKSLLESVVILRPSDRLAEVAARVMTNGWRTAVVVEDDRVVGILSVTDITKTMELARLGAPPPAAGQ
ncbi:MAG TPA: site-2 protease family protein [Candidatus Limnocylindrales bacterium]|nr:site-2 protease family protein [Candidatus Limnocylindrales bacterium]